MSEDSPPTGAPSRRPLGRRLLLWLATLALPLVFLVLLDLAVGALYERLAPPGGRDTLSMLLGEGPRRQPRIKPHPYMLYANTPGWRKGGLRQHNALGYRGAEVGPRPAEGTLRILTLGGSTTYGYKVNDPVDAWPARLERILRERLGRPVEVLNGGLLYATSAELLAHYLVRGRHLGADIVIVHTGGNDAAPLAFPGYSPEYFHFRPGWAPSVVMLRPGERSLLATSNIARLFYAHWFDGAPPPHPVMVEQVRAWQTVAPAQALANVRRTAPVGFRRNVELLVRNVLADGATPVLFAFELAPDAILERIPPEEAYFKPYFPAVAAGIEKNVEVMREVAHERGALFLDMGAGAIAFEDFVDHCHLSPAGHETKARFLADRLPLGAQP